MPGPASTMPVTVAHWSTSSSVLVCKGCSAASSAWRTLLLRDMWMKGSDSRSLRFRSTPDLALRRDLIGAGSATDQLAPAIGQAVTTSTKASGVVDNKPGANSFIGAQTASRAKPDGYTVFITTNTTQAAASLKWGRIIKAAGIVPE